jgi:hypothetical protein
MNAAMNFQVPKKDGILSNVYITGGLSSSAQLHRYKDIKEATKS